MAGKGSRFLEAGHNCPKYQINVKGKDLFEWSMESLSQCISSDDLISYVVRRQDLASDYIAKKSLAMFPHVSYQIIEIEELTDGQASTALLALDSCKKSDALIIYNIDTHVDPKQLRLPPLKGVDGWIPCFTPPGDHWSFAKINEDSNRVTEIKEKERISSYATIGLYYFKTGHLYEKYYKLLYDSFDHNMGLKEKYVAPIYQMMLENDCYIIINKLPNEAVIALGTPQEVESFVAKE